MQFNINRKGFSLAIKNTNIKYNPSTHFYDIGDKKYKNNTKELQSRLIENKDYKDKINMLHKDNMLVKNHEVDIRAEEILSLKKDLLDLLKIKNDLVDMCTYYKNNMNVIEVTELNINNIPEELQEKIVTKSIKVYDPI